MTASTPWGTTTGYFAIRDMWCSLCDVAKYFAAHAVGASLAIGHDATRRGHDGDTQAVHDLRDGLTTFVDTQTRTRHALDALDNRATGIVLKCDFLLRLRFVAVYLEAVDIAFVLQHSGNGHLELGGGHGNRRFIDLLRIAHTGQHIGDGIAHAHVWFSYQLALVMPGTSPRIVISRSLWRVSPNLLYTPRGRPVTIQRLRWRVGLELRGSCCNCKRA